MFGPETHDEAAAEFFLWPEEEEAIDFGYQEALFYPWLLFKWMVAPAARESSLPVPRNQTIVHSYLQRRGKKLDALEREYLENFAGAPFSFFEVTAAAPGKVLYRSCKALEWAERDAPEGLTHRVEIAAPPFDTI